MKSKILTIIVLMLGLLPIFSLTAYAQSIYAMDGRSVTISSDQNCTEFYVFDGSTLTVNQGVTLTLNISNGNNFNLFDNSTLQLHGTLAGSVASGATWLDNTYINVYLSDGAKYTVTGLTCMDGDNYLRYYGYDAATDGNGTVSVTSGSTAVTASSIGYKTTTYTFTATPASGYKFKNWTKGAGGEVLGTDASINVTCEQNGQYQVYANFEQDVPAGPQVRTLTGVPQGWTVQAGDPLTGVDSNADGSYSIAAGQPVLLIPSPEDKPLVKSVTLVEVPAVQTVTIDGITLDITGCTTWADIIARNPGVLEDYDGVVAAIGRGVLDLGGEVYTSDPYVPAQQSNYHWQLQYPPRGGARKS